MAISLKSHAKAAEKNERPKPVAIVEKGNIAVEIFSGTNTVNGIDYPQFRFTYSIGDRRIRKRFAGLEAARREAEVVATKLHNQQGQVLELSNSDREIYLEALGLLEPFGLRLDAVIREYVECLPLLPRGTSVLDAVKGFRAREGAVREKKTIPEVVTEYLTRKEKDGLSEAHLRPLRLRLNRFAGSFKMRADQVTGDRIQEWLDDMDAAPRTKRNELRNVASLLRFAVHKKYAPSDLLLELESVGKVRVNPPKTEIFTPDELRELFSVAPSSMIPWLTIGAFCGLRTAEILRLNWTDVNLGRKVVVVQSGIAKTAARRIVPLCDAAVAWLKPVAQDEGRVAPFVRDNWLSEALVAAANKARKKAGNRSKFAWVRNGLRHSFASYRLEIVKSADQVALECGNSARMVFAHYRELTTEDVAKQWFDVRPPEAADNVVSLAKAAGA